MKKVFSDRKEDGISTERQCDSDRLAKVMTKSGIKQLVRLFGHKCGISQLKAARCTLPIVNWALKNITSIRKKKITKISKRTSAQKGRLWRHVYLKYKDFVWIFDEESYYKYQ